MIWISDSMYYAVFDVLIKILKGLLTSEPNNPLGPYILLANDFIDSKTLIG